MMFARFQFVLALRQLGLISGKSRRHVMAHCVFQWGWIGRIKVIDMGFSAQSFN